MGCQLQAPGASTSGAESSAVEMGTEKSEVYSTNMTQAMGAGKCLLLRVLLVVLGLVRR